MMGNVMTPVTLRQSSRVQTALLLRPHSDALILVAGAVKSDRSIDHSSLSLDR